MFLDVEEKLTAVNVWAIGQSWSAIFGWLFHLILLHNEMK